MTKNKKKIVMAKSSAVFFVVLSYYKSCWGTNIQIKCSE